MDISKCFNGFGRLPVSILLKRMGMGGKQLNFWSRSISRMTRSVLLLGSYSEPVAARASCAEGDPLAVAAMVSIGFMWYRLMASVGVRCTVFADDWTWQVVHTKLRIEALRLTHSFLRALRLTSDPCKCWSWSTTVQGRRAWPDINIAVMGSPRHYKLALAERELGMFLTTPVAIIWVVRLTEFRIAFLGYHVWNPCLFPFLKRRSCCSLISGLQFSMASREFISGNPTSINCGLVHHVYIDFKDTFHISGVGLACDFEVCDRPFAICYWAYIDDLAAYDAGG